MSDMASKACGVMKKTALMVIDMQEKFRHITKFFNEITIVQIRLLETARILKLPIICTEQYPQGLGHTIPELNINKYAVQPIEKTQFSSLIPTVKIILDENKIESAILCGIETHVCVLQTALSLSKEGYEVNVIADATSSRSIVDRLYAFRRMQQSNIFISTSESIILSLLCSADHQNFKEILKLIKECPPQPGLLNNVI